MEQIIIMYAVSAYVFVMFALYMLGSVKLIMQEGRPPLYFAFLPFAHDYARAVIVGQRGRRLRILAPLATAVLIIAMMFPNIYFLAAANLFYLSIRCFLNCYTYEFACYKKLALLFTVLSILVPFSSGIWIYFTYRKVRLPL